MPKKSILILMVLFPLVVGLACRFTSSPDPTATPTEETAVVVVTEPVVEATLPAPTQSPEPQESPEQPATQPADTTTQFIIRESTWIQEESTVFVAYMIENPSSDILYEDVEFTIRLLGASGNLIDSSYIYFPWFFPSTTTGVISNFWLTDESVSADSVEINWTFTGTSSPDAFTNPFTTDKLVYWDNNGFPNVTGKVVNNSATTYTNIRTDIICYDSAGAVVGGGVTYLDFIHLNDYMGFTSYVDVFGDVARVEAFPTLTFSSELIDKTDFLSEIGIVEDYYYEDDFGYLQGGIIVKNETDSALTNSYLYITFYDEADNITTTGSEYLDLILPGDSYGVTPWISFPPDDSNSVRYDILILPGEQVDDFELDSNPFTVNTTTVTGEFNNYVLVNFTNTYSKQVSELDIHVLLYNADGQIIGGGYSWTSEPTPAGGTGELEIYVSYGYGETIETIKAWAIPSYFTSFE